MTPRDLVRVWRAEADILAKYSDHGAAVARRHADELEAALSVAADDVVSLREAHVIGGYSVDHLQRLVATGQLENVGRKHRPRIRRSDVPMKPRHRSDLPDAPQDVFSARRQIVASITGKAP